MDDWMNEGDDEELDPEEERRNKREGMSYGSASAFDPLILSYSSQKEGGRSYGEREAFHQAKGAP